MSERKTAEIKFRVAPSEKARWQAEAERKQLGLSELIRERMNEERVQPRSVLLAEDGDLKTLGVSADEVFPAGKPNPFAPYEELPVAPCGGACGDCSCPKDSFDPNIDLPSLSGGPLPDAAPQTDVSTSGEVGAVEKPSFLEQVIEEGQRVRAETPHPLGPLPREEKPEYPWMFRG